jgi:tetratricopeptide (TPR) repeat protein
VPSRPQPQPLRRRLAFSALTLLLFFLAVEVLLRLAGSAVLLSWRARQPSLASADAPSPASPLRLWAFGDSYTFGIGAEDPATQGWPAVAARLLGERLGRPVDLQNHGRPGLNSTEIVDGFEAALSEQAAHGWPRPDLVAVLAGVNNSHWLGQSGQFCLDEPGAGGGSQSAAPAFLRALRTWKLLRWLVLRWRPARDTDRACRDVAAGFQHLDDGYPDRAQAAFEAALRLAPGGRWARIGLGLSHARVGRHAEAARWLGEAAERGATQPALDLVLGFSLRAAGLSDPAAREAARRVAERPHPEDLADFGTLLRAWLLLDDGQAAEALRLFEALAQPELPPDRITRGGVVPYADDGRGWALLGLGRSDEAAAAFERSMAIGTTLFITPHLLGFPHIGRALTRIGDGGLDAAVDDLHEAERDSAATALAWALRGWIEGQAGRGGCAAALPRFEAALSMVPAQPQAAAGAARCAAAGSGGFLPPLLGPDGAPAPVSMPTLSIQQWLDPGDTRLLALDLERAAGAALRAGTRLWFLIYPQPDAHPDLAEAVLRAGHASGTPVLDPRPAFQAEFDAGTPRAALLVPDGHPSTQGHALMGRLWAEGVLAEP